MREVTCKDCLQVQRVEYLVADVGGTLPRYCSYCGSQNIERSNVEHEHWYQMAVNVGLKRTAKNAQLMQLLYEEWTPNFGKFKDFVLHTLKEAKASRKIESDF